MRSHRRSRITNTWRRGGPRTPTCVAAGRDGVSVVSFLLSRLSLLSLLSLSSFSPLLPLSSLSSFLSLFHIVSHISYVSVVSLVSLVYHASVFLLCTSMLFSLPSLYTYFLHGFAHPFVLSMRHYSLCVGVLLFLSSHVYLFCNSFLYFVLSLCLSFLLYHCIYLFLISIPHWCGRRAVGGGCAGSGHTLGENSSLQMLPHRA